MPQLVVWALGALGGAALVRRAVREARRINRDLDRERMAEVVARDRLPRLRRDPETGVWRPD